ncbi:hypothetical protein BUE93_21010 [Chromobacterium amazonense]|uniref:Uncharacterized protein n=1 Tax=Chromobacterium amazonense TaxID=1382803 RepID=A0A2S9WYZ1_9NEIS|nr:Tn7 transposase TnsA N-terminal domain-containing protein [Chromobacterium amazonense]PRP68681.1 hypothetical protein BUE93_21010 [Chromobacterium amazonense]
MFRPSLEERLCSYTPDYLIVLRDGRRCLVEVKYHAEAERPDNKRRYDTVTPLVEQAGGLFAVFTEKTLNQAGLRTNLPLLEQYRFSLIPTAARSWIATNLGQRPQSFSTVANILGRETVLAAIAQGLIRADIRRTPIEAQSRIWRA